MAINNFNNLTANQKRLAAERAVKYDFFIRQIDDMIKNDPDRLKYMRGITEEEQRAELEKAFESYRATSNYRADVMAKFNDLEFGLMYAVRSTSYAATDDINAFATRLMADNAKDEYAIAHPVRYIAEGQERLFDEYQALSQIQKREFTDRLLNTELTAGDSAATERRRAIRARAAEYVEANSAVPADDPAESAPRFVAGEADFDMDAVSYRATERDYIMGLLDTIYANEDMLSYFRAADMDNRKALIAQMADRYMNSPEGRRAWDEKYADPAFTQEYADLRREYDRRDAGQPRDEWLAAYTLRNEMYIEHAIGLADIKPNTVNGAKATATPSVLLQSFKDASFTELDSFMDTHYGTAIKDAVPARVQGIRNERERARRLSIEQENEAYRRFVEANRPFSNRARNRAIIFGALGVVGLLFGVGTIVSTAAVLGGAWAGAAIPGLAMSIAGAAGTTYGAVNIVRAYRYNRLYHHMARCLAGANTPRDVMEKSVQKVYKLAKKLGIPRENLPALAAFDEIRENNVTFTVRFFSTLASASTRAKAYASVLRGALSMRKEARLERKVKRADREAEVARMDAKYAERRAKAAQERAEKAMNDIAKRRAKKDADAKKLVEDDRKMMEERNKKAFEAAMAPAPEVKKATKRAPAKKVNPSAAATATEDNTNTAKM